MLTLFIDNKLVHTTKKYTVLQLCENISVYLPRFCYHSKLSVAANCRMCLVQLEDSTKPIASCAVAVNNNMRIFTNTNLVKNAREAVLEFLLINHPLDCPICDQGGECDLQDQTIVFGSDRGRFFETKRAVKELVLGPVIKTFMTRCIHCTRCIRFSKEILGVVELGLVGRGQNARISTFLNKAFLSPLSGNLSDVCPVGALTSKPYAFTARPWELRPNVSIDIFEGLGNNIRIDVRGAEIMRILPGSDGVWISDKTRLHFDGLYRQRIQSVFLSLPVFPLKPFSLSWSQVLFLLRTKLHLFLTITAALGSINLCHNQVSGSFRFIFGSLVDLATLATAKRFQFTFGSFLPSCSLSFNEFSYRSEFICSEKISSLKNLPVKVFLGFSPIHERPLFASAIDSLSTREFSRQVIFNSMTHGNSHYLSGGLTLGAVNLFLKGRSPIAQFFADDFLVQKKKLIFFIGGSLIGRSDYFAFKLCLNTLLGAYNYFFKPQFVLLSSTSINQAEVGIPFIQ